MDSINSRLKSFVTSLGLSNEDLRKLLLIKTKTQVSNWLSGNEKIPDKYLLALLRVNPNLNANWLLRGAGPMLLEEQNHPMTQEPTSPYLTECQNPLCAEKIHGLQEQIKLLREMNDLLKTELRRKVNPPENKPEGGVEEAIRRTG